MTPLHEHGALDSRAVRSAGGSPPSPQPRRAAPFEMEAV